MNRRLLAAAAALLAVWAAVGALAQAKPAHVAAVAAAGDVRLASDHDGTAILTAARLVPGQSVSGTVRLANTGDGDGLLALTRTGLHDVPGAGGAVLSEALLLRIDDVTTGTPRTVFAGALDGLALARIGRLAAGATRVYRITATLPDTGTPPGPLAGDNALQGASVRVDWTWTAEPLAPPPAPPRRPAPAPVPAPPASPLPQLPPRAELWLRAPRQRVLARRAVRLRARCSQPCRVVFRAAIRTARRPGHPARTLMARRVLRRAGTRRLLRAGALTRVRLRLRPRAVRLLRARLAHRRRAAVVVTARVRSAGGPSRVRRRVPVRLSPGSARRR